jgi:hypothetical protein
VAASCWMRTKGLVGGGPKPHGDDLSGFSWLMYIFFHIPPKNRLYTAPQTSLAALRVISRARQIGATRPTPRPGHNAAPAQFTPGRIPLPDYPLASRFRRERSIASFISALSSPSNRRARLVHFEVSPVGDSLQSVVKLERQSRDKGRL